MPTLAHRIREVAEWLKAHAWKACKRKRFGGSNPFLSAKALFKGHRFVQIVDFQKFFKKTRFHISSFYPYLSVDMVLPIVNTVFNLYTRKLYTKKAVSSYDICYYQLRTMSYLNVYFFTCSTATLFRLRTDGILPCSLIQGTYYYKLSDVDQMMEDGKQY